MAAAQRIGAGCCIVPDGTAFSGGCDYAMFVHQLLSSCSADLYFTGAGFERYLTVDLPSAQSRFFHVHDLSRDQRLHWEGTLEIASPGHAWQVSELRVDPNRQRHGGAPKE